MNAAPGEGNAGRGSDLAGDVDSQHLDVRRDLKGRDRPQATGAARRHPETQGAATEGQRAADALASRAPLDRETHTGTTPGVDRPAGTSARTVSVSGESLDQAGNSTVMPADAKQGGKAAPPPKKGATDINSMRSGGNTTEKRGAIPPLEDRFNIKRIGLVEKEYHFRDQAGKVAFTDKFMSIRTGSESPAAIKAMIDRAAERGWEMVRLNGSPEFVRQGWIAAAAKGLKAVGHTPTAADREAAAKERARMGVSQDAPVPQRPGPTIPRVRPDDVERTGDGMAVPAPGAPRQLAAAIEKALVDAKVSPELRGQVKAMMTAEGARRMARGDRVKVPVYDSRAPRARSQATQTVSRGQADRERSR